MKHSLGVIVGKNAVYEAVRAGIPLQEIWIAQNIKTGRMQEIINLARQKNISVSFVKREIIESHSPASAHQGIAALGGHFCYARVEDILERARLQKEPPLILSLDQLQDPQNLGSICRTAEAAGVHGVIIPRHHSAAVTPAAVKASSGAVFFLPVAQVGNLARTLAYLKKKGCWVAGGDINASQVYFQADLAVPLVLVVGSEGRGLRRLIRESCDFLLQIPLKGRITSLNAGVAAALLIFEALRQRREPDRVR